MQQYVERKPLSQKEDYFIFRIFIRIPLVTFSCHICSRTGLLNVFSIVYILYIICSVMINCNSDKDKRSLKMN